MESELIWLFTEDCRVFLNTVRLQVSYVRMISTDLICLWSEIKYRFTICVINVFRTGIPSAPNCSSMIMRFLMRFCLCLQLRVTFLKCLIFHNCWFYHVWSWGQHFIDCAWWFIICFQGTFTWRQHPWVTLKVNLMISWSLDLFFLSFLKIILLAL